MQQKRKRAGGDLGEEYVPPGLEQEEFDYEQQELAAVLEDDAPGKFTKVGCAGPAPACWTLDSLAQTKLSHATERLACH